MRFAFIAKHRSIWPVAWLCEALDVSRSGFHAWLNRSPSKRVRHDGELSARMRTSFLASDRTYGRGASGAMFWPTASPAAFTGSNG